LCPDQIWNYITVISYTCNCCVLFITAVSSPFVLAFDGLLKGEFAKFLDLSAKLGGEVQTQVKYEHYNIVTFY